MIAAAVTMPAIAAEPTPVVVELFTSQSCSSCPPAEAFLGELAMRDDVVALEFHVDYWDSLIYGLAGRWKDVHSSPANTERQRAYARQLGGSGVYTPQMVIDGRIDAVGSQTGQVERAIASARRLDPAGRARVAVMGVPHGIAVHLAGAASRRPVAVWLAQYRERETTRVRGGENHGKTLTNSHVVTRLERIGEWSGGEATLSAPVTLAPGDGCAVIVQGADQGPIVGAAACPKTLAPAG